MALDFSSFANEFGGLIDLSEEKATEVKKRPTLKEQDAARFRAIRKRVAAEQNLTDEELEAHRVELDRQIAAKLEELGLDPTNANTRSRWQDR